jgi:GTP cyclohydrolase I
MIDNKVENIKEHIEEIMKLLEIPVNNSTENTPLRIAKMYCNEVFLNRNNYNIDKLNASMKVFDNVDNLKDMVVVKDIDFSSMCEHHFMPFIGKIAVGYVPNEKIIGLSKIPRAVEFFSKKPQLQERLVKEIADYLFEVIQPLAIFVIAYDTTHTCVLCRGVESVANTVCTSKKYSGKINPSNMEGYNTEFYNMIGGMKSGKEDN